MKRILGGRAAAAKALPRGEWLQGGNWDQDRWGGEMPHKDWIDAVTPDTPVAVIRYDLHMLFLNSLALKLALSKNLVLPVLVGLSAWAWGIEGLALTVMVVAAGLPTGANVFLFAQRYRVVEDVTTAAMGVSTVLALFTLSAVMLVMSWLVA